MNWRPITQWALTLHIYVSMAGFTLLLLFAVTGLTLNHGDFGLSEPRIVRSTLTLPAALVDAPSETAMGAHLREALDIRSRVASYREYPDEIEILFAGPGNRVQVLVDRASRTAQVEADSRGFWGLIGDLHKGSDSGRVWFWIIDLTAVMFVVTSVTGMITLAGMRARRRIGFLMLLAGLVVSAVVYLLWVNP